MTVDFETVAQSPRFGFVGNVSVGRDISLDRLRAHYDAVILAYGAASDRAMGVAGENLANVCSARSFVNWYNGHPDFRDFSPNLDAEDAVVVGQGNVAIDCARILCKTKDELKETDIASHALEALSRSRVKRVHVVGRRSHVQAAMTMKELREVTRLADCSFHVSSEELARGRTAASLIEIEGARAKKRMDALLAEQAAATSNGTPRSRQLFLRFLLSPRECIASSSNASAVGAFDFDVTALEGPADAQRAVPTGRTERISAGLVLKSIGYKSLPIAGAPFDDARAVLRNDRGRVEGLPGLYCAGWVKRGPSGIIGTNIADAKETVSSLLDDKAAGRLPLSASAPGGAAALRAELVASGARKENELVSWAGWRVLDELELVKGKALGKSREKFVSVPDMLRAVHASP